MQTIYDDHDAGDEDRAKNVSLYTIVFAEQPVPYRPWHTATVRYDDSEIKTLDVHGANGAD